MATEFDDSLHWGFFITGTTLTSETGKYVRVSSLVLSALRAAGVFSNLVDGIEAPATDKLWLDKNYDPPLLKEWDTVGASWEVMTFDRLFARSTVIPLTITGGTANALIVSQPPVFQEGKLYSVTPSSTNTGPVTIQVVGVGTYGLKYPGGDDVAENELYDGRPAIMIFQHARFELLIGGAAQRVSETAQEAADAAVAAATSAANSAVVAGEAAEDAIAAAGNASGSASSASADASTASAAAATAGAAATDAVAAKNAAAASASAAALSETNAASSMASADTAKDAAEAAAAAAQPAPVGSVIWIYGDDTSVAPGYLLMNGFSVTNTYPDLRAHGLARGWPVDGNGDPICPNMGGKFPRGWLPGQVIDSGRVFGTSQADALRAHTHGVESGSSGGWSGDYSPNPAQASQVPTPNASTRPTTSTGGSETRPYNETFTVWIKAYAAHVDTSDIDLNNIANDINAVGARVADVEAKLPAYTATITLTASAGVEITGIPSWVNHMELYVDVVFSVASGCAITLGSGGVLQTTGYAGNYAAVSTGSVAAGAVPATQFSGYGGANYRRGIYRLSRKAGNLWGITGNVAVGVVTAFHTGDVELAGVLNIIGVSTTNAATMTGTVRVCYWR